MGIYALTGSASGIGAALGKKLSGDGHTLITIDIKDADIIADLTVPDGREKAISETLKKAPDGLDGFIPLAGLGGGTSPDMLITRLNYFGSIDLVKGLKPVLAKKNGSVVLLASNSMPMLPANDGFINALIDDSEADALAMAENLSPGSHYMQTKRAIVYWMQRNAMDYAREGIRMNAVAPGPTLTAMTKPLFESEDYAPIMKSLIEQTPIPRAGEADEIANCIAFLLSPAASYVCGSVLWVDGGYDAHTRENHI